MLEIPEGHRQPQRIVQLPQLILFHFPKAVKNSHILRLLKVRLQRIRLVHSCFPRIHRIDAVSLYPVKFIIGNIPQYQIGDCRSDHRLLVLF